MWLGRSEREWLILGIQASCAAIAFAATLYVIWLVGPSMETWLNPVIGKMRIVSVTWADRGMASEVIVEFDKKRGCEFVGLVWYDGIPGAPQTRVQVQARPASGELVRPELLTRATGLQRAGPWHVEIPAGMLRARSAVVTFHHCHPFWLTTSVLYP